MTVPPATSNSFETPNTSGVPLVERKYGYGMQATLFLMFESIVPDIAKQNNISMNEEMKKKTATYVFDAVNKAVFSFWPEVEIIRSLALSALSLDQMVTSLLKSKPSFSSVSKEYKFIFLVGYIHVKARAYGLKKNEELMSYFVSQNPWMNNQSPLLSDVD